MAMSRKHYREAAEIIRQVVDGAKHDPATIAAAETDSARMIAVGLARMFKADNSNFRREQFMEACGL